MSDSIREFPRVTREFPRVDHVSDSIQQVEPLVPLPCFSALLPTARLPMMRCIGICDALCVCAVRHLGVGRCLRRCFLFLHKFG